MSFDFDHKLRLGMLLACLFALPSGVAAQSTDAVQKQIRSKGGLLSSMTAKLQASESKAAALEADAKQAKTELKATQALIADLKATLGEQQSKITELSALNSANKAQISTTQAALDDSLAKVEALQEKETQLNALQAKAATTKTTLDELNTRIQEQDGIIIDLRNKLGSRTEKHMGQSGSTYSDLKADLDQALYKTRERDIEIAQLRSDVVKAKSDARMYRTSVDSLELQRLIFGGALVLLFLCLIYALRRRR